MKLPGLIVAALIAMLVAAAGASADDDDDHWSPPRDKVVGAGAFLAVDGRVQVAAGSGPNGEDPRGRFHVSAFGTIDVRGEVTCLNVQGRSAFISGEIQKGRPENFRGRGVRIEIRDSQDGRRGPDRFNFDAGIIQEPLTVCPSPGVFSLVPVDRGNFVVHDSVQQGPPPDDDEGDDDDHDDDDDDWDDLAVQSKQLPTPLAPSDEGELFSR